MNLSDGIQLYLTDRRAKGIAAGTIRAEKHTLELLLADVGNLQLSSLRPQHMDLFWSRRTSWAPGSMNRGRYHLEAFVKWCQKRGYIRHDASPLAGMKKLRVPPRPRVIIPQEEFETFLAGIEDPRGRAMAAIGLYLFTRISETQALRWQDVDMHRGTVEVFRQKTQTLDTLPLCSELADELRRWALAYGSEIGRPLLPTDFVIPALKPGKYAGVPGARRTFVRVSEPAFLPSERAHLGHTITKILKEAGYYQPHEGGHTLRRSGAVALYNQLAGVGHDRAIRICQAMLGHTNLQTTEVYLRLDLDRKVRDDLLSGKRMFPDVEDAEVVVMRRGTP